MISLRSSTASAQLPSFCVSVCVQANAVFGQVVLSAYKPGDMVWVQDYHLMLLPSILKQTVPRMKVTHWHTLMHGIQKEVSGRVLHLLLPAMFGQQKGTYTHCVDTDAFNSNFQPCSVLPATQPGA